MTRQPFDTRGFIGAALALLAALFILANLLHLGCSKRGTIDDNARRAVNAMTVDQYRQALAECHAEGLDAGSLGVYVRCADEADKHFGASK